MNQKSVLSAVCLCLVASAANAEIINYSFSASQQAQAASTLSPTLNDTQAAVVSQSTATSYTNTISAYRTDSLIVSGVDYGDGSASASSALGINADIDAGVFSGWGNIQTSVLSAPEVPGAMSGFGHATSTMSFMTTAAYEYTLDVTISPGEWWMQFGSSSPYPPVTTWRNSDLLSGQSLHLSGTFLANSIIYIGASYTGGAGYSGIVNGYKPSGSFQYTLTLTPVPVPEPETWGLMLTGLGLVGWAARRRKHAAV